MEFASLDPKTLVADVIVNPRDTPFLAAAKARGCQTIDGHGMLVNQAIIGVAHWTGVTVDGAIMRYVDFSEAALVDVSLDDVDAIGAVGLTID